MAALHNFFATDGNYTYCPVAELRPHAKIATVLYWYPGLRDSYLGLEFKSQNIFIFLSAAAEDAWFDRRRSKTFLNLKYHLESGTSSSRIGIHRNCFYTKSKQARGNGTFLRDLIIVLYLNDVQDQLKAAKGSNWINKTLATIREVKAAAKR